MDRGEWAVSLTSRKSLSSLSENCKVKTAFSVARKTKIVLDHLRSSLTPGAAHPRAPTPLLIAFAGSNQLQQSSVSEYASAWYQTSVWLKHVCLTYYGNNCPCDNV